MNNCINAYDAAFAKLDRVCSSARLQHDFCGDAYPMQLVVQSEIDDAQIQIDGTVDEHGQFLIIYSFDGSAISWKSCNETEIDSSLNNKLVSAFKNLCNAYAHARLLEYMEAGENAAD